MPVLRRVLVHWKLCLLLLVLGAAGLTVWLDDDVRSRAVGGGRAVLAWAGIAAHEHDSDAVFWCPMHPQIKRNRPNEVCPICNMALVPLEGSADRTPHTLVLTPQQVQQAGVVYRPVLRRRLSREIDTTGRLEYDERRRAGIASWVRGKSRIDELHVNFTGARVTAGEVLAELYSPELIVGQEELLNALDAGGNVAGLDLVGAARRKLLDQGMTPEQLDEIVRTETVLERIPIPAPISGTVVKRHVQEGEYVEEGDWLFHLADLSHLWLFADVYEEELPLVDVGQSVTITVAGLPGEEFEGEVSFVDPELQRDTRTVRVRIEVDNARRRLKPGMFARVQFEHTLPETLAVPDDAVLWSGQRAVAIVRAGEGTFEPREVRLGRRWLSPADVPYRPGGTTEFGAEHRRYHEVLAGLRPGDEVVVAGAFLLNAEASFQSVLTKMLPPASRSATLEEALGPAVAERLRGVLEAYYGLTAALADDRLDDVSERAASLVTAATELAETAAEEDRADLERDARRLADRAGEPVEESPADLRAARVAYGRISRSAVRLLEDHGGNVLLGEDVFLFRCGMAKVGYENWMWWSPDKHNPYMGRRMLDCGSQLKSFRE